MNKDKVPYLNSYLITCFRDWIIACGKKPYMCVDANQLDDPKLISYANNGQLVLNIDPNAIVNYHLDDEGMSFRCRFNGVDSLVKVPLSAILVVFAQGDSEKSFTLPPLPIVQVKTAIKLVGGNDVAGSKGKSSTKDAKVVAIDFHSKK